VTESATPTENVPQEPLAVVVNGWPVTLAEYQAELSLFQSAGTELATDEDSSQIVLDELIDQALLAQAAQVNGFSVDEASLQARIDQLALELGSMDALQAWWQEHGFNEATFRQALKRNIAAAWMRDQIASQVPLETEQIHARQILLYNSEEAASVLSQLKNGADFTTLAFQYDPTAGGDIGWFPRGYLLHPEVEEAAFNLLPDQFSDVIETYVGYHIIQVIERDPTHPLEASARLVLQEKAVLDWVAEQRDQATIEILIP